MAPSPKRKSSSTTSSSRHSSNGERSVVIRVPKTPDASVDPLLCSFPSGLPAALQEGTSAASPEEASMPHFVIQKQSKGDKLIVGKDHACLYTAVAPKQPVQERTHQVCIGIYDKHTQQVTLQPVADNGFIYTMTQSVPSYQARNSEAARTVIMSAAERRQALYGDFGSSKKQKVLRSQEANRVNVESVVGAGNVNAILSGMSESNRQAVAQQQQRQDDNGDLISDTAADQATQQWRQQFLPTYNTRAADPTAVYSAEKIAGTVVWKRLLGIVTKCLEQDNVLKAIVQGPQPQHAEETIEQSQEQKLARRRDTWYPSVVRILKLLVPRGEAVKKSLAATILLNHFLHLYMQMNRKRFIPGMEGSERGDRPRFFGVPVDVGRKWLEMFTTPAVGNDGQMGHCMSKANKDCCCVHMFLLYLIAEGGGKKVSSDNIQPLADDLNMDVKEASNLLRLAGCTVARKSVQQTTATLRVPLTFPSLKKGGKRG